MKINLKNRKQKGFTLVELLLVVGIIALGAVVAYITLPKVQSTARANAEATNINTIAAGVKNVYAGTTNYTNLTNVVLGKAKALPDRMVTSTDSYAMTNGFGGDVTIAAAKLGTGTGANNAYAITYAGVPNAECTKLATGVGNNFAQVSINGSADGIRKWPDTTPILPDKVAEACGATTDNNILIFTGT